MNKIDEIVEKISPSSQINADLIDAIDLEEFIIRVINNSQLSCRKMYDLFSSTNHLNLEHLMMRSSDNPIYNAVSRVQNREGS